MAYAALVSLMQITQQILQPNYPHPSLHSTNQINSLHEKICSLLDLLEDCSHTHPRNTQAMEILEARIRYAAFNAEDIVESHVCNHFSSSNTKNGCFWRLFCALETLLCSLRPLSLKEEILNLENVIQEMDFLLEEVKIKDDGSGKIQDLQLRPRSPPSGSSSTPRTATKTFVGFEEEIIQLKNRLSGHQSELQIIPIVGMGGMGKTTLARNLYDDQLIVESFDIRVWVTVSQEYCLRDILSSFVRGIASLVDLPYRDGTEYLAECLYKCLKGRRYLIVMDDVWDTKFWDEVKFLFPNDNNGSRIMLTTRILDVAMYADSSCTHYQMRFLNEDESWALLRQILFGNQTCPPELEEIGKRISKNCQGLPLAILVIGGLLSKLSRTEESWGNVSNTVSWTIAVNDEQCSEILSLSYNYLPPHLRPCFLYVGVFPEDSDIHVSKLIKLWMSEGFLKPVIDKSLEDVAEDNLQNLVDRNLISVRKKGSNGKMRICSIHDLLRDLCMREAHKQQFFNVLNRKIHSVPDGVNFYRRLIIHQNIASDNPAEDGVEDTYDLLKRIPYARSFISIGRYLNLSDFYNGFKFLRVLDIIQTVFNKFPVEVLELINLRYLALRCHEMLPSSISALWNLHVLIFYYRWALRGDPVLPSEIWIMPQLRHLLFNGLSFPDPFSDNGENSVMLENLQTISLAKCSPGLIEFIKTVPNLKKLGLFCKWTKIDLNLVHLQNLEKLKLVEFDTMWLGFPVFPHRLKKLTLRDCSMPWEKMMVIGSLPDLEVLKLQNDPHGEDAVEWIPSEGCFRRLKFLMLKSPRLEHWGADSSHFPRLESLILRDCGRLKEIPSDIGEIPTLQLIDLRFCSSSAVVSAQQILEEQQDMGNMELRVLVTK